MKRTNADLKQLRSWCLTMLIFWSVLLNGSLILFVTNELRSVKAIGREIGLAVIYKDTLYELWNAEHGGVYVAEGGKADKHAGALTKDGRRLVLINPARMTREVYQLEQEMYGVRSHITSLNAVRSEDSPDEWERNALRTFANGSKEAVEIISKDGKPFIRVMAPSIVQASCLACHAGYGYAQGDVSGGISVTIPIEKIMTVFWHQFKSSLLYHLLIYAIGLTGLALFYVQTGRQLTRRAEMERQLAVQEQHLRSIVENISAGIAVYEAGADGFVVKSVNPAGKQAVHLEPSADPAGKKAAEVFPEAAESGLLAALERVEQSGLPEHLSLAISGGPAGNGRQWLDSYVYKLPTGEVAAMYEDITARKEAEAQLLRKTQEWENTFDAIPDIIVLQDKEMRIIRANQATFEFFHLPPDKLLGRTCHSLFRGADAACPGCPGVQAMSSLRKCCSNVEHKPIARFFHVCAAPVLNGENDLLYLVYIAHDITDKKRLEDELFQAQKMEAIGTLAGGIAHDFNNILAAILGYTELARMELPDNSNARADLDQVLIAGSRATDLVKQILTFSRKSEHLKKPLRIYLIVKEAVKMMRSSLPSTIEIKAKIDENSGLVLADPTSIHQIVFNLCTNAAHAIGSRHGRMEIELRRQEVAAAQAAEKPGVEPGWFVVLTVRDNGSGMSAEIMARIFDPYFTTKEQGAGTGLGLAVTHGIVEDSHGFIEVESELGKGSVFHVYLPLLPEENRELQESEQNMPLPKGRERILFVDDEPAIVHISRSILGSLGYTVTAETESLAALNAFRKNPAAFDLVVTDHTMPGMTGSELAKAMLKLRPELPIILCTGYTAAFSEKDALAMGIKRYAVKPLNAARLAGLVRDVLNESRQPG